MLGSTLVGLVGVYEEGGAGVSRDVDLGGFGSASDGWEMGVGSWVGRWRACVAGDGFQALHWIMLS